MIKTFTRIIGFAFCMFCSSAFAQLTVPAGGGNKKASVSEKIALTQVTINYDRPGVKGREGKIWGQLIHTGFADLGFGSSKAAPWRAGANENTTIEFSDDVKIEGKPLQAGKYGFFIAYGPEESTLIFSKNSTSWGSFFYDEKEDALRVKVKPVALPQSVEWLKYEFLNETPNSATVALEWEKLMIPFKVEVDYVQTQLASFRRELRSDKGFKWEAWVQAAQFAAANKTNLEEGLAWADKAVSDPSVGQKNFNTLSTKAMLLAQLGRGAEADAIMKEALPLGRMAEVHAYARQLLAQKKTKEAFDVFKLNFDKNPGQFTVMMGMVRGYSGIGDYKNALAMAQKASPLAPDKANKDNVDKMIAMLKEGKDVN